jgi:hypothetical protein
MLPPERDYSFHFTLFSLGSFWEFKSLSTVLDLLDGASAPPERLGENDIFHSPYTRAALKRWFRETRDPKEGRPPLSLKRLASPAYMATVNVGNAVHPHSIHLESGFRHREGDLEALFALADALAAGPDTDFASIDLGRDGAPPTLAMLREASTEHLGAYIENGPGTVWTRTYFGPRLLAAAGGKARFTGAGGRWRALPGGVLALDLAPRPWLLSPKELKAAQRAVSSRLKKSTGIFAVPNGNKFGDDVPGPRWSPPPGALWPA